MGVICHESGLSWGGLSPGRSHAGDLSWGGLS